jgi:hypothetical protein
MVAVEVAFRDVREWKWRHNASQRIALQLQRCQESQLRQLGWYRTRQLAQGEVKLRQAGEQPKLTGQIAGDAAG